MMTPEKGKSPAREEVGSQSAPGTENELPDNRSCNAIMADVGDSVQTASGMSSDKLRDLLVEIESSSWDGVAGRQVIDWLQLVCRAEARHWSRRAGTLEESGVSAAWEALARWVRGDRSADPVAVARRTIQRETCRDAAAVEYGVRPRSVSKALAAGLCLLVRPDGIAGWDQAAAEEDPPPRQAEPWVRALALMLRQAGWAWPQPAGTCVEVAQLIASDPARRSPSERSALSQTGVPAAVWSTLALLVGGSGPGCNELRAWPSVPQLYAIGGVPAVVANAEVKRLIAAAVAGRATRTKRTLVGEEAAS